MQPLKHTLISDGSSDANLIPIIDWTLRESAGVPLSHGTSADFWRARVRPRSLTERIEFALENFPCDVLFVHRDAEREPVSHRHDEILRAIERLTRLDVPVVAVVPVRMLEAWMLFDEAAIRNAAGNPTGHDALGLPRLNSIEGRPDPKEDLNNALVRACGLHGRRKKKFNTAQALWRIMTYVSDFSPLRQLDAFRQFEAALAQVRENEFTPGFYPLGNRV